MTLKRWTLLVRALMVPLGLAALPMLIFALPEAVETMAAEFPEFAAVGTAGLWVLWACGLLGYAAAAGGWWLLARLGKTGALGPALQKPARLMQACALAATALCLGLLVALCVTGATNAGLTLLLAAVVLAGATLAALAQAFMLALGRSQAAEAT